MTTSTLFTQLRTIGQYTVCFDAVEADGYQFQVYDGNDDLIEEFETKREAIQWARESADTEAAEAAEEARQARLDDLRSQIEELACECDDEATLARVVALLSKKD